jgi:hypothetical protein
VAALLADEFHFAQHRARLRTIVPLILAFSLIE